MLYYFAGASQADIASALGMSHEMRVMLHHCANRELRNLLEDDKEGVGQKYEEKSKISGRTQMNMSVR